MDIFGKQYKKNFSSIEKLCKRKNVEINLKTDDIKLLSDLYALKACSYLALSRIEEASRFFDDSLLLNSQNANGLKGRVLLQNEILRQRGKHLLSKKDSFAYYHLQKKIYAMLIGDKLI